MSGRFDRMVNIAVELQRLGVSGTVVTELLLLDLDVIERQLAYLPYRKARRKSAFIVDAIRNDYSPPVNYPTHAPTQNEPVQAAQSVDSNSQRPA